MLCFTAVFGSTLTASDFAGVDVPEVQEPRVSRAVSEAGDDEEGGRAGNRGSDFYESPQTNEAKALRKEAVKQRLATRSRGKVQQVAGGQFVELELERNDRVFVVLVEYGALAPNSPTLAQTAGPLHNAIAPPDRAVDNSTIWQPDYNRAHFEDMYFNKMVDYYRKQSSGRYTINGDVTEWVKVPFNGARYGANSLGTAATWSLIADAINIWTAKQLETKTMAEVQAYLRTFDQWDRYDYNNNGNFDEPDGYIDHFQIVHAGIGEETDSTGTPDAIWSHRWFAFYNWRGIQGPTYNPYGGLEFGGGWGSNPNRSITGASGASVGTNPGSAMHQARANVTWAFTPQRTGIWVGDYTIQPENGGLGVFAHEYGHDLGLPDHYDTNGGSNGVGFWNIMASGSYLGDGTTDIGTKPGDMSAWDKLVLGWLNYEYGVAGQRSVHRLGPAETNTKAAQAVVVELPPSANVDHQIDPVAISGIVGTKAWWGGLGDNRDVAMTRTIAVPATAADAVLRMRLSYNLETDWDYAYVSISNDGGATWANLAHAGLTRNTNPNNSTAFLGNGITGTTNGAWVNAAFNLASYAGQNVMVRIRYKTDAFTHFWGIAADSISIGTFADGAEAGDNGWTLSGFAASTGVVPAAAPHYYIAEFRQYRTYDQSLQTGPYTFGTLGVSDWVTHYPYQDGLLVWYYDSGESDNDITLHRGEGEVLPIDSHPEPLRRERLPFAEGLWNFSPWSATIQTSDAPFGLQPTDALAIPFVGTLPPAPGSPAGTPNRTVQFVVNHPSQPAVPVFNDLLSWWHPARPENSVIVPKTGTSIKVVSTSAHDGFMLVHVEPVQ